MRWLVTGAYICVLLNDWWEKYLFFSSFPKDLKKEIQQSSLTPKIFGVGYGSSTDQSWSATCIPFCHSILSEVILYVTSLIDMPFFTISTSVIFGLLLLFFVPSIWINSLFLTGALIALLKWTWTNYFKRLSLPYFHQSEASLCLSDFFILNPISLFIFSYPS